MAAEHLVPLVAVIMGSRCDWETLRHAAETLEALGVRYEAAVMSAHLPGMTAINAALLATAILGGKHPRIREALTRRRTAADSSWCTRQPRSPLLGPPSAASR